MARQVEELDTDTYDELRRIAQRVRESRAAVTVTPTVLVHEAWEKLAAGQVQWNDRTHFLALSARAMRQILVDHLRAKASLKRGGGHRRTTLSGLSGPEASVDLLDFDEALRALEQVDPGAADVVVLRCFGGLTMPEVAEQLEVSERTAYGRWAFGRAFVLDELDGA